MVTPGFLKVIGSCLEYQALGCEGTETLALAVLPWVPSMLVFSEIIRIHLEIF